MARNRRLGRSSGGGFLRAVFFLILSLAGMAALATAYFVFEFERPSLSLGKEVQTLGASVDIPLTAQDKKSGLRLINISLIQGEKSEVLFEKQFPRQGWFNNAGPKEFNEKVTVKAKEAGFAEGAAKLVITLRDQSLMGFLRGNKTVQTMAVTIDTTPPTLSIVDPRRYIQPGGSAVIAYTVSETPARHGVQIGETFFPGFPGTKEGLYLAYFALPWDAKETGPTAVVAYDAAGNEAKAGFSAVLRPVREKRDTITLSDNFLQQKMPEFKQHYPEMEGDLLTQYLYVNDTVRQRNAEKIAAICATPVAEQLWSDRFLRMPGANRAGFADQRTYLYQGKAVDKQTHLGVDIASTAQAEVRAANRGKVVFAEYLGIYGNVVILDHGQGLFSLYSHLNSIEASMGALVDKNQAIGRTGTSGMAGGDHLHFSMLVHGIFVTPIEWWDQRWIDVNIKAAVNG